MWIKPPEPPTPPPPTGVKPTISDKDKKNLMGCGVVIGIIIVLMILGKLFPSAPTSPEDNAEYGAIAYLKDNLNDPDSLKIDYDSVNVAQPDPQKNEYVVYFKYRAKNGFGAYDLYVAKFVTDSDGHVIQNLSGN
jgi:hypothetical protein